MVDQDRPDDLAAGQQRHMVLAAPVAPPEPYRQAGPRLGPRKRGRQRALGLDRRGRLQAVGAVVAVEDRDTAAGDGPLQMVLEEVVGLGLGLAELHGVANSAWVCS
jgi:hypothetical protein